MPMVNWQSKVNDIQKKILAGGQKAIQPIESLSMDLKSNGSNWSNSPINLTERLLHVINYSDFKCASTTKQTPTHGNLNESNNNPICTKTQYYAQHGDTIKKQILPTTITSNPRSLNKCAFDCLNVECCSSNVSIELNQNQSEQVLNVMEMAKKNIVKLIDDQIQLIKIKPPWTSSKRCKQIKELEMVQAIKTVERQDCIRRMREELTFKMDTLNKLLCELDEKS